MDIKKFYSSIVDYENHVRMCREWEDTNEYAALILGIDVDWWLYEAWLRDEENVRRYKSKKKSLATF